MDALHPTESTTGSMRRDMGASRPRLDAIEEGGWALDR
jgi:hypothetical protein